VDRHHDRGPLDEGELGLVGVDLVDALDRAGRRLGFESTMRNHAAARAVGVHPTDWLALDFLDASGPLPIGDLAAGLGLSRAAATALVDRLEASELAERRAANDRRVVVVAALATRGDVYDTVDVDLRQAMASHAAAFDTTELQVVLRFMRGAAEVLAETTRTLRLAAHSDTAPSRRAEGEAAPGTGNATGELSDRAEAVRSTRTNGAHRERRPRKDPPCVT
jgi:DNA-binding MarR family transcriptional regulator